MISYKLYTPTLNHDLQKKEKNEASKEEKKGLLNQHEKCVGKSFFQRRKSLK